MPVYKTMVGLSARYLRAETALQARLIAFYNWGKGKPLPVVAIGQQAPDIGRAGYNRVVSPPENVEDFDVIQHVKRTTGKVTSHCNGFYKLDEERKAKRYGKALQSLAALGLAA